MEISKQFFLPEEYRENFYVKDFLEIKDGYKLIIYEKKELIPEDLQGKEVVSNGFCNSLTLVDNPLKAKLMYLEFHRRRWKEKGSQKSYSNTYTTLHPDGCKLTQGFGDFLKGLTRHKLIELCSVIRGLEDVCKENKLLV